MGLGPSGAHQGARRARQQRETAVPRAPIRLVAALPRDRQPVSHLLQQALGRRARLGADGDQSRSAPHAARVRAAPARRVGAAG